MHRPQDIGLGRLAHRVLLVVRQSDHILPLIAEELVQICAHVLDVVDTSAQLSSLAKVVDTNEESFPSSIASRVLERIALRSAVAEVLGGCGWWGRSVVVTVCPLVAIHCGHHA